MGPLQYLRSLFKQFLTMLLLNCIVLRLLTKPAQTDATEVAARFEVLDQQHWKQKYRDAKVELDDQRAKLEFRKLVILDLELVLQSTGRLVDQNIDYELRKSILREINQLLVARLEDEDHPCRESETWKDLLERVVAVNTATLKKI
ncbi:hypothetical protein DL98DRAFT_597186 [Cadophora sp. DSE1049]|nr:hypothetical protein DL98DRAFT_597186 [Cadophora sp. DSE1049]